MKRVEWNKEFVWEAPIPSTQGPVGPFAVERIEEQSSFSATLNGEPIALASKYRVVGVSLCITSNGTKGKFYEAFTNTLPVGTTCEGGMMVRIDELTMRDGLLIFGRMIAKMITDNSSVEELTPLLEVPVLGGMVAQNLLRWLTVQDFHEIAESTIPNEKEASKIRLRDVLFAEVSELINRLPLSTLQDVLTNGILGWDNCLADQIEKWGAAKEASELRKKRTGQPLDRLWKIWLPQTTGQHCWAILYLAKVLWKFKVKPLLDKQVALVRPVFSELSQVMGSPYKAEENNGQRILCYKGEPIEIAQVDQSILELVDKGFAKIGTIVSHRVIREIVFSGYAKQQMTGQTEVALTYPGGMSAFCSAAGCTSNADPTVARQILHALAYLPFKLPNNFKGNLIALQEQRAGNGRQGLIVITPGPPLLANYVFGKTGEAKLVGHDSFLVPLLPIPPLVGRANNHAQQVVLSQYAVLEMRDRAQEMAKEGAIRITQERWVELAIKARMPRDASFLSQVIDRWTHDGDDGPALLSRKKDMFTLADTHEAARNFIIKGGKISERNSSRGKKARSNRDASIASRKRVQKVGS